MLFDVDIKNTDRGSPNPNTHDKLMKGAGMARGTNSVNYIAPKTNGQLVTGGKNGQFTVVQTGFLFTQQLVATAGAGHYASGQFLHAQLPHGLPYTPSFAAYDIPTPGSYTLMPRNYTTSGGVANAIWTSWRVAVDAIYVYLYTEYMLYNYTLTTIPNTPFRYYLLLQPLS